MDVRIYPAKLQGEINATPYKSMAIRAIIAAAFSDAPTEFLLRNETEDITSTINCLNKLGANISGYGEKLIVHPIDFSQELSVNEDFNVGDSVATFKFLLPSISALLGGGTFTGTCKLPKKSTADFLYSLSGVGFTGEKLPLKANGKLKGGTIKVLGSIGSQAISGILMALPLLSVDTSVIVVGEIPSEYLVETTLLVMREFGINVVKDGNTYLVKSGQKYCTKGTFNIEGDYTFSSYFLCGGAFSNGVTVNGLNSSSLQPDKKIYQLIEQIKGQKNPTVSLKGVGELIYPITVLSCYKTGETIIVDAPRKSEKAQEKFKLFLQSLRKMGADIEETDDGVKVNGTGKLKGGVFVDSFGEAKIAMALAIAASGAEEETYLLSAETAIKSYPSFFNDYMRLGGKCQAK